jgi:hypothetical protein
LSTPSSTEHFASGGWRTSSDKVYDLTTELPTETFVTGDRVSYRNKNSGIAYTGTLGEPHPTVEGWNYINVDGHGTCILPVEYMSSLEKEPSDLPKLVSRLENEIADWQAFMKFDANLAELRGRDQEVVDVQSAFDQGLLAGLRKAVKLAEEQESL